MILASTLKTFVLPVAIIASGLIAVFYISVFIERHRPPLEDGYGDTDLHVRGSALKGFVLGMEGLIADFYYMRSLQYIGDKVVNSDAEMVIDLEDLTPLNPRLLYPYLDTATDLDPHFIAGYTYGSMLMPAIDREKAVLIARKGVNNNPNTWRLYQNLGYIYWKLERYPEAAETFQKGSEIAGAAPFMKMMAIAMQTQGSSRSTARVVYQQMLADSDDEMIKLTAERRLASLDALDEQDAIDKVLAETKVKTGACVNSLTEIMPILMNVKLPGGNDFSIDAANHLVDPTGIPYQLDREDCRVHPDPERTGLSKITWNTQ